MRSLSHAAVGLLLLLAAGRLHAQTLVREDVLPLFGLLGKEQWNEALKEADRLIKAHPQDTSDLIGIVNYASVLSACALVADGRLTYKKLGKHMDRFVGKRLWMAAHPTTLDTAAVGFNTNVLSVEGDAVTGRCVAANKDATTIYCFEQYRFDDPFDPATLDGQRTRMGGVLERYEPNPNGSRIWILRLHLVHAVVRKA